MNKNEIRKTHQIEESKKKEKKRKEKLSKEKVKVGKTRSQNMG